MWMQQRRYASADHVQRRLVTQKLSQKDKKHVICRKFTQCGSDMTFESNGMTAE